MGTVRVGNDSTYANNPECTTVSGQGFYNCGTELHGQYISFHATDAVYATYGLFIQNFKAYGSDNLVMLSGTTFEVASPNTFTVESTHFNQPFETKMKTMAPRYTAMGGEAPYQGECGVYDGMSAGN